MGRLVVLLSLLAASLTPATAANSDRGRAFAEANCARCHALPSATRSPNPTAPPFVEIARRYPPTYLEEALAEGIRVGHAAAMPEFRLAPRDIDDLIAYLERLRRGR